MKLSKNKRNVFLSYVPRITQPKNGFLGQKVSSVAWRQTDTKMKHKNDPKNVIFTISKNKKMRFFPMSQGSFSQKIRFLGKKVCSVGRTHTHKQTDRHESENRGHPLRVSGFFQIFLQPIIKERSNTSFGTHPPILSISAFISSSLHF